LSTGWTVIHKLWMDLGLVTLPTRDRHPTVTSVTDPSTGGQERA